MLTLNMSMFLHHFVYQTTTSDGHGTAVPLSAFAFLGLRHLKHGCMNFKTWNRRAIICVYVGYGMNMSRLAGEFPVAIGNMVANRPQASLKFTAEIYTF